MLIGPNDAGKSKLFDVILWALNPNSEVPIHKYEIIHPTLELMFFVRFKDNSLGLEVRAKIEMKYNFYKDEKTSKWEAKPEIIVFSNHQKPKILSEDSSPEVVAALQCVTI